MDAGAAGRQCDPHPRRKYLVGNFGRYFFPLFPALALLAVLALDDVPWTRFRLLLIGRLRIPLGVLVGLALLLIPAARLPGAFALALQARANIDDGDVAVARWVARGFRRRRTLAVCDIGRRWPGSRRIRSSTSPASPPPRRAASCANSRAAQGMPWPPALYHWIERVQPDYVVLFPHWFPLLEQAPDRFPGGPPA